MKYSAGTATPMTAPHKRISVASTLIEGVDDARRAKLEAELRKVLSPLESADFGLVHDVTLHVLLTDRMEHHVDRIRKDQGCVDVTPYRRARHTVSAAGITLFTPDSPLVVANVVLASEPWAGDSGEDFLLRIYLLCHELGHVLQRGRGGGVDYSQRSSTNAEEMRRAAAVMRDEFDADQKADGLCKLLLRDDAGNPVSPGVTIGPWFAGSAVEVLERLCALAHRVQDYREGAQILDELYQTAGPLIGEAMLILTHAAALFAGAGDLGPFEELLHGSDGFKTYIAPDWDDFLRSLIEKDDDVAETRLVEIAEGILHRLGLRIEDLPSGLPYVHVHGPLFCSDGDPGATEDDI